MWLTATPLVGCVAEEPDPVDTQTFALTSVVPASNNCNQGVGANRCVQAPPFEVTSLAPWTIDGARGAKEYAGSVTLPFMTDASLGGLAGPAFKLQANGTVHLQRVTLRGTLPLLTPRNYLYVFLENVHVLVGAGGPLANVNVYLDNDRFNSPDNNVHAEDRRYQINLASGSVVTVQQPSGSGAATVWGPAPMQLGLSYAAGGCTLVNAKVARCSGELKIPLVSSAATAPAPGLAPGIGFMARTTSLVGMSPDLALGRYATSDFTITDWQTVLFTRPKGFDLAITTWNVRRFEALFQSAAFLAVDPNDIGQFLARNDIVAIQEGWDRGQVTKIFDAANLVRAGANLPPYNLYGPIDHQPAMSEVTQTVVDGLTDTQGGLWVMSHLPLATQGYHIFTADSCRGEDCWKAKGVQWVRLMLQDPADFDPKCLREKLGCNKPPSGDDFVDVFNTHLQANEPLLCKGDDFSAAKYGILSALAAIVDPVMAIHALILSELVEADLNCSSITDREGRLKQLHQMNTFISAVAAPDRSSLVMGDFNIDGKLISGSEYRDALVTLRIAPSSAPGDDTVSALPPGGFDIRHGDILRERTDVDFSTGRCTGTFIDESGGTQDPSCTFAGGTDATERLDYILVRPPQLVSQWQGYPSWYISAVPNSPVWTSPFPSLSGAFSATPLRLSDHKPITTALTFARLGNPPKYNAGWKHTVEQRLISVDATDVEDCIGCGEVDPFAKLESLIKPANSSSIINPTAECTGIQNPIFGVLEHSCMDNWVRNRSHTPPNETAVSLFAEIWDDDNTSGDDLISEGTTSQWNYNQATFDMSFRLFGVDFPLESWPNFEAVPMSRCAGPGIDVCHRISITEIAP
ncbi:MAG: endonuclease/exonuclease/phosphatase family protein [Deltaproteobacteria bacterium]|nr:endonuclease/exonuclease/phosphatase family protein [Deltaproteobacteria bacterium]